MTQDTKRRTPKIFLKNYKLSVHLGQTVLIINAVDHTFLCGLMAERVVKVRVPACKEKVYTLTWWVTHFITLI